MSTPTPDGCQWMLAAHNWADCGEPATHRNVRTSLRYCAAHAHYAGQFVKVEAITNVTRTPQPAQQPADP